MQREVLGRPSLKELPWKQITETSKIHKLDRIEDDSYAAGINKESEQNHNKWKAPIREISSWYDQMLSPISQTGIYYTSSDILRFLLVFIYFYLLYQIRYVRGAEIKLSM